MSGYVPLALRRLVAERSGTACEYCRIREADTGLGCQVEHIISEKHGGRTTADNLALACTPCNQYKGTDIATLDPRTGRLTRLFNPRTDRWADHFAIVDPHLRGLTDIGRGTVRLLRFNDPDRLLERGELIVDGLYPAV